MEEMFKIGPLFVETKKACLKKTADELEKYIVERYGILEKAHGKEFVLENVRLSAAIATYLHRVNISKEIPAARLMKFLKENGGGDKALYGRLDAELKAAGFPFATGDFIDHLFKVNNRMDTEAKFTGNANRKKIGRTIKIKKRRRK